MACGSPDVSRDGLRSAPTELRHPELPGPKTGTSPVITTAQQQIAIVRRELQNATSEEAVSAILRKANSVLDSVRGEKDSAAQIKSLDHELNEIKHQADEKKAALVASQDRLQANTPSVAFTPILLSSLGVPAHRAGAVRLSPGSVQQERIEAARSAVADAVRETPGSENLILKHLLKYEAFFESNRFEKQRRKYFDNEYGSDERENPEHGSQRASHTLVHHTGHPVEYLKERWRIERHPCSSFNNGEAAVKSITQVLTNQSNIEKIQKWLDSGSGKPFYAELHLGEEIGYSIRDEDDIVVCSCAAVVLERDASAELQVTGDLYFHGCRIKTSYPIADQDIDQRKER